MDNPHTRVQIEVREIERCSKCICAQFRAWTVGREILSSDSDKYSWASSIRRICKTGENSRSVSSITCKYSDSAILSHPRTPSDFGKTHCSSRDWFVRRKTSAPQSY